MADFAKSNSRRNRSKRILGHTPSPLDADRNRFRVPFDRTLRHLGWYVVARAPVGNGPIPTPLSVRATLDGAGGLRGVALVSRVNRRVLRETKRL
jgi:hypothetical protein